MPLYKEEFFIGRCSCWCHGSSVVTLSAVTQPTLWRRPSLSLSKHGASVTSQTSAHLPLTVLFTDCAAPREPVRPRASFGSIPLRLFFSVLEKGCGLWTLSCDFSPHS